MEKKSIKNLKRMSVGNSKLAKSVLIFDLPAIKSCLNCKECAKTCYAMKAQRMYKETAAYRELNYELADKYPALLYELITDQLERTSKRIVRIHASGDFFHQGYLDFWTTIIAKFPHIKFYAYTKVEHILDFSIVLQLKNFNLVRSIMPEGEINYGPLETVKALAKKYKAKICPATLKKDGVKCGETCKLCMTISNIVFVQH